MSDQKAKKCMQFHWLIVPSSRFMPSFLRLGSWNIVMFVTYEQIKRSMTRAQQYWESPFWACGLRMGNDADCLTHWLLQLFCGDSALDTEGTCGSLTLQWWWLTQVRVRNFERLPQYERTQYVKGEEIPNVTLHRQTDDFINPIWRFRQKILFTYMLKPCWIVLRSCRITSDVYSE